MIPTTPTFLMFFLTPAHFVFQVGELFLRMLFHFGFGCCCRCRFRCRPRLSQKDPCQFYSIKVQVLHLSFRMNVHYKSDKEAS